MKATWGTRWAAALLAVAVAAGCGTADGPARDHARSPGEPEVRVERDLPELPLDAYEFSARDYDREETATRRLTQRCMRSYGFRDFPSHWREHQDTMAETVTTAAFFTSLYGVLDLDRARRLGYGVDAKEMEAAFGKHSKGRLITQDEEQVLHGEALTEGDHKVKGRTVPEGGCYASSARRLRAGAKDEQRMIEYVMERRAALDKAVAKDARMRRALDTWADCVADKGFKRYASPEAAFRDKAWGRGGDGRTTRTRRERDTAVADIECKREHNTAGVWWLLTAEKQRRDISRHQASYDAVRADLDRVRAAVRRALGE
ncbi:hypothetical protein ABZ626_23155 [Streptomyces longispororuber]|uniref:hypothetical protein n=1 Tax=Streptomyces longispororuber TaxID=68230 RepID=UPI0033DEC058